MLRRVLVVLIMAMVLVGGFALWRSAQAQGPGEVAGIVESRRIEAGSKVGGRVTDVLVEEGQMVAPGAPMIRFDVDELRALRERAQGSLAEAEARLTELRRGLRPEEIRQAEAGAEQAAAQLAALREGPRRQEIEQARAELRAAEAELVNAKAHAGRTEALVKSGDLPQANLDNALARLRTAGARVDAAQQRVALLEAGTRPEEVQAAEQRLRQKQEAAKVARLGARQEEIRAAEARVQQAKANLAQLEVQLREGELLAPAQARVESVAARPGDLIPAGRVVVTMLEQGQTWVRAYVPEPELAYWKVGAEAEVAFDTKPERWYRAVVQQISAQAEFLPRNIQTRDDRSHQVFGAKVQLTEGAEVARSGMSAMVRLKR